MLKWHFIDNVDGVLRRQCGSLYVYGTEHIYHILPADLSTIGFSWKLEYANLSIHCRRSLLVLNEYCE